MNKLISMVLVGFFCSWACTQNQIIDCTGELTQITFDSLLPDTTNQTCILKNINESEQIVNLIIQSQAEYENYVSCTDSLPFIDFSTKTLLAGRMKSPNEDKIIEQKITVDCNGNYLYSVDIGYGIATHPIDVYYYAIIPKIPSKEKMGFDIEYIN